MAIFISAKRVGYTLLVIVLSLTGAHLASQWMKYFGDHDYQFGLEPLLNLNTEASLPTWYSSSALLLSAILVTTIALFKQQAADPYRYHWIGLSVIFLGLSVDEVATMHETVSYILQTLFHTTGFLFYTWVIPGMAFALIVSISYLRFVRDLPTTPRWQFFLAGALYVGGALGVEMVGAWYDSQHGMFSMTYSVLVACEEFLEMLGIVVFIYALLSYLASSVGNLHITFQK
jgi:hypothetical protein